MSTLKLWLLIAFGLSVVLIPQITKGREISPLPHSSYLKFRQKLDHFDSDDSRFFSQRYFVDSSYARGKHPPVFYVFCGETPCGPHYFSVNIKEYARVFGAQLIALEHRYYGESIPFDILSKENLSYLTIANALEDLANFQIEIMKNSRFQGPWITFGGSYPGMLSAFYRLKYPDLVIGAVSSSAPVQANLNFEQIDLATAQALSPECAADVREVTREIEGGLLDPLKAKEIKKIFGAEKIEKNINFMTMVADAMVTTVMYGRQDYLCRHLAGSENKIYELGNFTRGLFSIFGNTPYEMTWENVANESRGKNIKNDVRQWAYQVCRELGNFQVAYHDPAIAVRSSKIDIDFEMMNCQEIFELPHPDVDLINKNYYLRLLDQTTTNILFVNGEKDPWARASISQELGNNTNPGIATYTVPDGYHCEDLNSSNEKTAGARALTLKLISKWLTNP